MKTSEVSKKKRKLTTIDHIEHIVEYSKQYGLKEEFYEYANPHLSHLMRILKITKSQAILFAHFMNRMFDEKTYLSDIAKSMNCSRLKMTQFFPDIEALINKKLLIMSMKDPNNTFRVPKEVTQAVAKNVVYKPNPNIGVSFDKLFEVIDQLFEQNRQHESYPSDMQKELEDLIDNNAQLPFCQQLKSYQFSRIDLVFLLMICNVYIKQNVGVSFSDYPNLYEDSSMAKELDLAVARGENKLIQLQLIKRVDLMPDVLDPVYSLTSKGVSELFPERGTTVEVNYEEEFITEGLLHFAKISKRNLYFGESLKSTICKITTILNPDRFEIFQSNLRAEKLPPGFTCLLYGPPGTGKTEAVMQFAAQTGRNIMQVDISEVRSKYVGESEKNLTSVFQEYKRIAKMEKQTPILLFNEADALFAKRISNVKQTIDVLENAFQNVLLQELETFDGILFATTNFQKNFDVAFERRFLFKIKFENPDETARCQIWRDKLSCLAEEEAKIVANKYPLNGAQIESVVRKYILEKVIADTAPSFDQLLALCQAETPKDRTRKKVGFI